MTKQGNASDFAKSLVVSVLPVPAENRKLAKIYIYNTENHIPGPAGEPPNLKVSACVKVI